MAHNGAFPVSRAYAIIDRRQTVLAHGTRDMPIWGFLWEKLDPGEFERVIQHLPAPLRDLKS